LTLTQHNTCQALKPKAKQVWGLRVPASIRERERERERVQTHLVKMVARTPPKLKRTLAALNPVLIRETLNKVLIN